MDWKRIEPTIVSKVGWRTIVSKTFILPDGRVHHFQTISEENSIAAGCIAITKDKKVLVASQFRPGQEKILEEIPGGNVDQGEDPETAVKRELLEETGYVPGKIEYLGKAYRDAYYNGEHHYYLATDCVPHEKGQQSEDTEFINVKLISVDQLLKNGREGKMTDTEALFLAYDKLLKLRG
jgi:ADP-ribose pyrophosphatase